jgi:hypothetical protein
MLPQHGYDEKFAVSENGETSLTYQKKKKKKKKRMGRLSMTGNNVVT